MCINDLAVSSGSACTSATLEPSYVLKALGVGEDLAHTSIRFGLGRFYTQEEVDYVIDKMVQVVFKLRELSSLYVMFKVVIDISKLKLQTALRSGGNNMAIKGTVVIDRSDGVTAAVF